MVDSKDNWQLYQTGYWISNSRLLNVVFMRLSPWKFQIDRHFTFATWREKWKRPVHKFPASTENTHSVDGRRNWNGVGINNYHFLKNLWFLRIFSKFGQPRKVYPKFLVELNLFHSISLLECLVEWEAPMFCVCNPKPARIFFYNLLLTVCTRFTLSQLHTIFKFHCRKF